MYERLGLFRAYPVKRIVRRAATEKALGEFRFAVPYPVLPFLGREIRIPFARITAHPPRVSYAPVHAGDLTARKCESHLGNAGCFRWVFRHRWIELHVVEILRRTGVKTTHLQPVGCKSDSPNGQPSNT